MLHFCVGWKDLMGDNIVNGVIFYKFISQDYKDLSDFCFLISSSGVKNVPLQLLFDLGVSALGHNPLLTVLSLNSPGLNLEDYLGID